MRHAAMLVTPNPPSPLLLLLWTLYNKQKWTFDGAAICGAWHQR